MIDKLQLWRKLLWATVIGVFSTTMAYPQQWLSTHQWKDVSPHPDDPHWLLVDGDLDGDFLSDIEEIALGLDENDRDMNDNWWADGIELGKHYHGITENLPWWAPGDPIPNEIYRIDFSTWGMEQCEICGVLVNMGFIRIVNPQTSESLDIQHIGLHYMLHGSFSYEGTVNDGRVDVVALASILHDAHLVPVENDSDTDYLSDQEESTIGYDPDNPDEDGNWVSDGADLAGQMATIIDGLPQGPLPDQVYRIEHFQYGIEFCEVCGEEVNMGYVEIHNPMLGSSIQIDYVALHTMAHDSFTYDGTIHDGRIDMAALKEILEGGRHRF
jgi:hypothetical protein